MKSNGNKKKKINKKKVIATISILVIVIGVICFSAFYSENKDFMDFCDEYIFRKNITEEDSKTIEFENLQETKFYAYKQYILALKDNVLTAYNKYGYDEYKIDIEISNPIFTSRGDYLCIAEKNGQKLYMVLGQNVLWQRDVEGEISDVKINENGYCTVTVSGTIYKTTVQVHNSKGIELFKKHLSKAIAISSDISNDNKYLAIGEVNYDGITVQSNIEIISIESAESNPEEAIIYTYNAPSDSLIINVNYQTKNNLLCMYDTYIDYINSEHENKKILDFNESIINADINMESSIVTLLNKEKSNIINITDTISQDTASYQINDNAEDIYVQENTILVNLGTELLFINNNGWLIKKYNGSKEMKNVIFTNEIAAIIYKDKIDIISL